MFPEGRTFEHEDTVGSFPGRQGGAEGGVPATDNDDVHLAGTDLLSVRHARSIQMDTIGRMLGE